MNKKTMLLLSGIVVALVVLTTGFFLMKTSFEKRKIQPCNPATTNCIGITPLGTPYTPPPKEESAATTTQSGKIDEHLTIDNTLRDVNFCGKISRVKQVVIDGVDVVQRIAELITKSQIEHEKDVCTRVGNEIGVSEVMNNPNLGNGVYEVMLVFPTGNFQHIGDFQIDTNTGNIFIILQGYDGSSKKLVGKL